MTFFEWVQGQIQEARSYERRSLLLTSMDELEKASISCAQCGGTCCTFVANSMQVTPLEALEVWAQLNDLSILEKLENCVRFYRLDYEIGTGKTNMRKTYTCPFFLKQNLGCPFPFEYKPYGCLAFNPVEVDSFQKENCCSNLTLLEKREGQFKEFENEMNDRLRQMLGLSWEKKDLPRALIDVYNCFKRLAL